MKTSAKFAHYGSMVVTLFLAGCGGADGPKVAPVKGKVTVGGSEPFKGGLVRFIPAPGSNLNSREATTGDDGSYTVMFWPNKPGLEPGDYTVMFSLYKMPDGDPVPDQSQEVDPQHPTKLGAVQLVPPEYETGKASDCSITISDAGGTFDFDLPELKPLKK